MKNQQLEDICKNIINKGFQELKTEKFCAYYTRLKDSFGDYDFAKNAVVIRLDKKTLFDAPVPVLEGVIAHEISHVARDRHLRTSPVRTYLYSMFEWHRQRDERETDLLVIERGFGPQLLAFVEYIDKKGYYCGDGSLSMRALRKILA